MVLVESKGEVDVVVQGDNTIMRVDAAIREGEADILLKEWLLDNREAVNCQYGGHGGSLLHTAVAEGDRKAATLLIAAGARVDLPDSNGRTALHIAASLGNKELLNLLLERSPPLTACDSEGDQPIHRAARAGHVHILEVLLSRGADLTARGHQGDSLLHCGASTAQLGVVYLCLQRGIKPDTVNSLTETALHKVSAFFARGRSVAVAKVLLDQGASLDARTEWGDTAAHYAARHGAVCMLKYLLDEGISLLKEGPGSASKFAPHLISKEEADQFDLSLLSKVARSTCFEKSRLLLDLMVDARFKQFQLNHAECLEQELRYFPREEIVGGKLTFQQKELLQMGEQLQLDLKSPGSPFQMFLKYSPDALNHLFNRCMMKPVDLQLQGRLFFDLFLFAPCHKTGCELGIIVAVLDAKKERFLLHPTFDLFLQLKWAKIAKMFYFFLAIILVYEAVFFVYTLQQFSCFKDIIPATPMFVVMVTSLGIFSALKLQMILLNFLVCHSMIKCSNKPCWKLIAVTICTSLVLDVAQPSLASVFLFLPFEDATKRSLCSVLLFTTGLDSLSLLSKLPKIGVQTVMMGKVASSVFSFFTAFVTLFLAFCLMFHVLLPTTQAFGSLENAFIKVLAMLMGEFDFTANFTNAHDTPFIAKIFFLIFIMIMALVFMNLLLGLAVSDIGELERISKIKTSIFLCQTIVMMNTIVGFWKNFPCLRWIVAPPIFQDGKEIYLDVRDLDPSPENKVFVQTSPEEKEEYQVPHAFVAQVLEIYKSRVLAARGFNKEEEKVDTKRMEEEMKQMKKSLEKITKMLEIK